MNQFRKHNGSPFPPVALTTRVEVTCVIPYRRTFWEWLFKLPVPTVTAPAGCLIWALVDEFRVVHDQPAIAFTPPPYLKLVK